MERIAIIGAGLMGHGIAQVFTVAGHPVKVYDAAVGSLATLCERIHANLVDLGLDPQAAARVQPCDALEEAVADADVVFEAAPEKLGLKQSLFAVLERLAPATVAKMIALLERVGKTPVHVRKDVPGFVGNRLQHALWREAIALVQEGVCDAHTVDTVVKAGFGRRLAVQGPLETADLVGLDLTLDIHENVLPHIDRTPGPLPYLKAMARADRDAR